MNLRSNLLLCVALVTGTALAFGTKAILKSMPEEKGTQLSEPQVAAMVAKKDLVLGEEITPQNIRFERLPESSVPTDVIFHYKDAAARTLNQDVKKGQMISLYYLNDPNENGLTTNTFIPLKNHYVSFLIDSIMENGNVSADVSLLEQVRKKIQAGGDRVSFLISYEKEGETDAETGKPLPRTLATDTLLTDIEIHQVKVLQKVTDNAGSIKTVLNLTFILSDEQLDSVNKAAARGKITIVVNDAPNDSGLSGQPILLQGTVDEKEPTPENRVKSDRPETLNETRNGPTLSSVVKASPFDYHEDQMTVVSSKPVHQKPKPLYENEEGDSDKFQTVSALNENDEPKPEAESNRPEKSSFMTVSQSHPSDSPASAEAKLFRKPRISVPRGNIAASDLAVTPKTNP